MRNKSVNIFISILCLLLTVGCASKRNTALTRQWSAFTTRYNVHFNGEQAYLEALRNMEEGFEDNFSEDVFLHPVSIYSLGDKEPNNNFARAIEKSQKAIKLKSMPKRPPRSRTKKYDDEYKAFLERKEFNPFLHNSWLMLAKSEYYQGDFLSANATFQYIIRRFNWLPETVLESRIWSAKCYTELGWVFEADNIVSQIDSNLIKGDLKKPYYELMTAYYIKKGDMAKAEASLQEALKERYNKSQKARMRFLLAQLYRNAGDNIRAYEEYKKVIRINPPYRTVFNAQIAQTEVMPLSQHKKIEKKLNRMLRDPRNEDYLDQVHYALGNLALHKKDTLEAMKEYQKAIDESTRGGIEKALPALRLGDIAFEREEYLVAQPAYSTAISIIDEKHKEHKRVSHLSEVLDNLAVHAETVHLQDSLLTLASLPEELQLKAIQKIIDDIIAEEKEEAERIAREEYEANRGNYVRPDNRPTIPNINNGDDSWYFYNKLALSNGRTEFQRKWGSRKPEDDWRRRNKTASFGSSFDSFDTADASNEDLEDEVTEDSDNSALDSLMSDPKNPVYYLNQLPLTAEAKAVSQEMIEDATYNMGNIFNQQLDNLPLAIKTMLDIEKRNPTSGRLLDVYYEVFLMYMRMGQEANANIYRDKLIAQFTDSPYAMALKDPEYVSKLRNMQKNQGKLYEETYEAYLNGDTKTVHSNYAFVKENWPLSDLMAKFLFLDALSYVADGNKDAFKRSIDQLTAVYPESDVAPLANEIMRGINQGRALAMGGLPPKGMLWKTNLVSSGLAEGDSTITEAQFTISSNTPHLLVLAYQTDSIQSNELLFEIAKYNFTNYLVKDFDLETMVFNDLSMLIIKGFDNFDELSKYRLRMTLPYGYELSPQITPIMISDDNFRLLLQGRSFDDYFEFIRQYSDNETKTLETKDE